MTEKKSLKTESYSDSVKRFEKVLLPLGKKSKGNFDVSKFFESDDDIRADYSEGTFKDRSFPRYVSWG